MVCVRSYPSHLLVLQEWAVRPPALCPAALEEDLNLGPLDVLEERLGDCRSAMVLNSSSRSVVFEWSYC